MFVNADNAHLANEDAIDLLDKLLVYDHQGRLSAAEVPPPTPLSLSPLL